MKSFFKKLAFVMALAMVVTLAAPAAKSALAATDFYAADQTTGAKVTSVTLKAGETKDLKFIGAPEYKSVKWGWESDNTAVATVDKAGIITAVADGKANVTITVGEKKATVAVTVGEVVITEVKLGTSKTDTFTEKTLEIGESVDLNFYGVTDWATGKYTATWVPVDPTVVSVDKLGVVTALAAGTTQVTCVIVNNSTGDFLNVVPVTVTVPAAEVVVDYSFTIKQLDTVSVELTFGKDIDLTGATAEDFAVTAIDEMFEYTLFANTAAVDKNVVTLTFVEGVLTDEATIKIGYKDAESTLVASNGDVVRVEVVYGMNDKYTGDAYIYTELDPDYVLLSYKLFDAKGIDVTKSFKENDDYTIEWTLVKGSDFASEPEEDADNGWQMSFDAKGTAVVKATVTFTDNDGEERPVDSKEVAIKAVDRPAISFKYEEAGLVNMKKDNKKAVINSFNTWYGTIWSTDAYVSSIKKGTNAWFGARLTDNRGRGLVSTNLTYDAINGDPALKAVGNTEYGDYGYFVYESSNEDVLDIDSDGYVSAVNVGSATILVSFVKYGEDGEELAPVKVCSKKISVTTDYPEPYAKTFEFINDSVTVTSTGSSVTATAYLKFYDQYGNVYADFTGSDLNSASAITVPAQYSTATLTFGDKTNNSATGWVDAYPVVINGEDLNSLVDIKDNGYSTFKFKVEFDKDLDAFSKIVTKNDTLSAKVYNVDKYYADLQEFYSTTAKAEDTDFVKWNWAVSGAADVNVYVDKRTEFDAKSDTAQPSKTIKVSLNSAAGLKLMDLPKDHFIELTEKVETINNKKNAADRGLIEGAIYYQITVPSHKATEPRNYDVATGTALTASNEFVKFTFNKIDENDVISLAKEGAYSVSLYYVNSQNKLVKLGNTVNINVTNTTPAVKAEGFYKTNVYENGTIADTKSAVIDALAHMYNFTWNGESLYNVKYDYMSDNFFIDDVEYTYADDKVVVTKVVFGLKYFNNNEKDGNGGVTNNANGLYQTVELNKRITLKFGK